MNLAILSGPLVLGTAATLAYRGTYRATPTYCDEYTEDAAINKAFMRYLDEGGESGILHDLAFAFQYTGLLNSHYQDRPFEIVEVVPGAGPSVAGGKFVGFDLSSGCVSSLLPWGLEVQIGTSRLPFHVRELCHLLAFAFRPHLNARGLFNSFEVASLCRRSMCALQETSPCLFEGGDLTNYEVVGLYVVPLPKS